MSSLPLSGKIALVTGSSRGIGAAIAHKLAADGAKVVVNYVSSEKAAAEVVDAINAKRPSSAIAIKADVSSSAGTQSLLEQTLKAFGRLDILALNAALMGTKTLAEIDEAYYTKCFDANVKGPLFLVKSAAPHLEAGSSVIFFSSSLTKMTTVAPIHLVYVATKGAIEQIARVLAKDLGAHGVTVNTVSPGPMDTDMFRDGKTQQQVEFYANLHPQKRIGQTNEVAGVVAFLAGPDSRWVNGQNILVNGGMAV